MGPNPYSLKYKTFDSLLADVMVDFKNYSLDNMIEPQELIRVAKWVNADLGLRVYKTHQTVLDLQHGKVRLPDDFYVFNYALLCGEGMVRVPLPQGTTTMEVPFPLAQDIPTTISTCDNGELCPLPVPPACGGCMSCDICAPGLVLSPGYDPLKPYGDPCLRPRVFMNCKGDNFELIQVVGSEARHWKIMLPLELINPPKDISCDCPNLNVRSIHQIWIKDGFLYSNISCGKIYLNYQGALEDEDGNLLVIDHDIITPFYEYKLKDRILENLYNNGEEVSQRMDRNEMRLKIARKDAKSLVNMPDFAELRNTFLMNRRAYNHRYVNMFRNQGWYGRTRF